MAQLTFDDGAEEGQKVNAMLRPEPVRVFCAEHEQTLTALTKIQAYQRLGPDPTGGFAKDRVSLRGGLAQRNLAHAAAAKLKIRIDPAWRDNDHGFGQVLVEALYGAGLRLIRLYAKAGEVDGDHVGGLKRQDPQEIDEPGLFQ